MWLPDKEFFVGQNVAPTPMAPGTKRCRLCASWSPWGALTDTNGISADLLWLLDKEFFVGQNEAPTPMAPGTKRCRPCASWSSGGALRGHPYSTYAYFSKFLTPPPPCTQNDVTVTT